MGKLNSLQTCVMMTVSEEETELCVQINQPRSGHHASTWSTEVAPGGGWSQDRRWGYGLGINPYVLGDLNHDCQLATGFVRLKPAITLSSSTVIPVTSLM